MDTLEVAGEWWMPEHPDNKIPGVLRYDPSENGRLTLIGGLRRPEDLAVPEATPDGGTKITVGRDLIDAAGKYGRLHGECDGKAYTLEGCFQLSSTGSLRRTRKEVIYVNHVYQGIWFAQDERAEGDELRFTVSGLAEWSVRSGLVLKVHEDASGVQPWAELQLTPLPDLKASLPSGGELTLIHTPSIAIGSSASLAERLSLTFAYPNAQSIEELTDAASDMQDLVSIATDRSAAFQSMQVCHPVIMSRPGGAPFTLWATWTARELSQDKPLQSGDMFFNLDDIGGMAGLASWMRVAEKFRSPLGRVMATIYTSRMYVSDRLLNRAVALEGFDRIDTGVAQGRSFAARITRCIDIAGPQFAKLVHDPDKWATELKHHRNELAHHYGRRMSDSTEEAFYIGDGAYWLLVFCLLRQLPVQDSVIDKIMTHGKLQFLARKNKLLFA